MTGIIRRVKREDCSRVNEIEWKAEGGRGPLLKGRMEKKRKEMKERENSTKKPEEEAEAKVQRFD